MAKLRFVSFALVCLAGLITGCGPGGGTYCQSKQEAEEDRRARDRDPWRAYLWPGSSSGTRRWRARRHRSYRRSLWPLTASSHTALRPPCAIHPPRGWRKRRMPRRKTTMPTQYQLIRDNADVWRLGW